MPGQPVHILALWRTKLGINRAGDTGAAHIQIISTDALRRSFQMALAEGVPKR